MSLNYHRWKACFRVFAASLYLVPILACLFGCDQAKQTARDTREGYRIAKDIAAQATVLINAVRTNDFAKAKQIGMDIDGILESRVIGWYVDTLTIEEQSGPSAALEKVRQLRNIQEMTEKERASLDTLEKYLVEKGETKTSAIAADLLVMGCAVAVEAKYGKLAPHGALGGIVLHSREIFREKFGDRLPSETTNSSGL